MYGWKDKFNATFKIGFISCALLCFSLGRLAAEEPEFGLKPPTPKETHRLKHEMEKIVKVKPNKVGAARIRAHLNANKLSPMNIEVAESHTEEFTTVSEEGHPEMFGSEAPVLPSSVDNSALPSFPPIGNQGSLGSCVAWSSTYYVATHEVGLANGYNNKTSNVHVFSPKWTYNLINGGVNSGSSPFSAYNLLSMNGAPSIASLPCDSNYRTWDLNPNDWIDALSNRLTHCRAVYGFGGSQAQNLQAIKQVLANGHVLSIGTYANSWVTARVPKDPLNPANPYVGQVAITWMKGTSGAHLITIVGYNDNLWIDVNGNGKEDPGERGAFLLANSWGTNWGNKGFIWISYDAFLNKSAVPNGPSSSTRLGAAEALYSYGLTATPIAPYYTPKLVAQFTLDQAQRNQLDVHGGISSVAQMVPSQFFFPGVLNGSGGSFNFDGSTLPTEETVTFALDLTDLLPTSPISEAQRFYLSIKDAASGHPSTLSAFTLLDKVHQRKVSYPKVPLVVDAATVLPYIDYDFANAPTVDTTAPRVRISAPVAESSHSGTIYVTANASDDREVKSVEFYVDSKLVATDTSSPYVLTLDTTALSNGKHRLSVIAYDTSNNKSMDAVSITVSNQAAAPLTPPRVVIATPRTGTSSGLVYVSVISTGDHEVKSLEFYVDEKLVSTAEASSHVFVFDSTKLVNGMHQFSVIAYDIFNNSSQDTVTITIANYEPFRKGQREADRKEAPLSNEESEL